MTLALIITICWLILLISDTKGYMYQRKVSGNEYVNLVCIIVDICCLIASLLFVAAGMYHR